MLAILILSMSHLEGSYYIREEGIVLLWCGHSILGRFDTNSARVTLEVGGNGLSDTCFLQMIVGSTSVPSTVQVCCI